MWRHRSQKSTAAIASKATLSTLTARATRTYSDRTALSCEDRGQRSALTVAIPKFNVSLGYVTGHGNYVQTLSTLDFSFSISFAIIHTSYFFDESVRSMRAKTFFHNSLHLLTVKKGCLPNTRKIPRVKQPPNMPLPKGIYLTSIIWMYP